MMKKSRVLFLFFVFVSAVSFTLHAETLSISTVIPDDFGIQFPADALMLDRFAFELWTADGNNGLVYSDRIDIDDYVEQDGSLSLVALYYGNLSYVYKVQLVAKCFSGWRNSVSQQDTSIPIKVDIIPIVESDDVVFCSCMDDAAFIEVLPAGPQRGIPVAEIELSWNDARDVVPGNYYANLCLEVVAM